VKVYLDEDISPEVAVLLRASGVDATSVHEEGRQGLSDREQLQFSAAEGRCLVTRNRNDFILLTREFFERGLPHAGVLILPWTVPPDNFRLVAKKIALYANRIGDSPTDYLFDFV
jgi:predicted nuclease of predicted toxin-antitoxin system